ncbi:MAG: Protoheme IX farnesyltransferase [Verrucomicrobiae bacterium]|nr:Protoheme IX farnesyltransferase [Verrucomicrobiae bacterium]
MTSRWLHRLCWVTAGATFLLIVVGATVTSNRAGLSVPDWPETYSHPLWRFPLTKMVGGIFYEHGHRLLASVVGLLTTAITVWTFFWQKDKTLRRLGLAALAGVLLQGLLGGLTVKFLLPPVISVAHAALAQAFFCVTITLALLTSSKASAAPGATTGSARGLALAATIAVYLQLILGASIRHSERGELAHICGAIAVIALAIFIVRHLREFRGPVLTLAGLIIFQAGLGILTLYTRQPKLAPGQLTPLQTWLPTLHLATGALILAVSFVLTLRIFRQTAPTPQATSVGDLIDLTKPRIVLMVLVTTALGFFLGGNSAGEILILVLVGVGLATGGSAVLNNYLDRDVDAKMARTRDRALPAGLVAPAHALALGVTLVLIGVLTLVWAVNLLTGFLVLLAAFLYVLVYTPLKRVSWFNTTVGAIPGAIPPLCGWAAATGRLDLGAWVLFAIMFVWQHPHFYAIAWMFKDDYRAAGLKMLPTIDPPATFRHTRIYSVILIGISVLPAVVGMVGVIYICGAVALGVGMLAVAVVFARTQTFLGAKRLLKASVIYLPLLVVLMIVDRL